MRQLYLILAAALAIVWFGSCSSAGIVVFRAPGTGIDEAGSFVLVSLLSLGGAIVSIILSARAADRAGKREKGGGEEHE